MTLSDSHVTQLLTSAYPSVHPPQDLLASLLANVQNASPDPAVRRTFPRLSRPRWLAACFLLIPCLVLALYVATQQNPKPVPTPSLAQQNPRPPATPSPDQQDPRPPATPSPDRAYIPLDWDVEASSLVLAGKIEKVQEGVQKQKTTVYDGGILRISEVLKDSAADPAIKPGGTITVHVLTRANLHPDAFSVNADDEGIWILHRNGTLVTPEMRLELARRQEIANMIARQAVEQAANKDRVLREWAAHEATFKEPAYGLQQLEADIKRGPDLSLPPESLRAVMVQDATGTRGWVFIDSRGKVALATPYHAIMWSGFSSGLAPRSHDGYERFTPKGRRLHRPHRQTRHPAHLRWMRAIQGRLGGRLQEPQVRPHRPHRQRSAALRLSLDLGLHRRRGHRRAGRRHPATRR